MTTKTIPIHLTAKQYERMLGSARNNGVTFGTIKDTKGCMCLLGHAASAKLGRRIELGQFSTHEAFVYLGGGHRIGLEYTPAWQHNDSYVYELNDLRDEALRNGDPTEVQLWADEMISCGALVVGS